MRLSENLWSCECEYQALFRQFTSQLGARLGDGEAGALGCGGKCGPGVGAATRGVQGRPQQSQATPTTSQDLTPILVSVFLAVLLIVVGYILAYTFRARWDRQN